MEDEYVNHTIVLPGPCPVIIAVSKTIAVDAAKSMYGEKWESKGVTVRKTTVNDFRLLNPRGTK
ncbi:hypothetical protein [Acinetobacter phage ABPH49]|nr:hypothetical protein [Acinetobacter phage ABPH49]